jgi:hypothetical protein
MSAAKRKSKAHKADLSFGLIPEETAHHFVLQLEEGAPFIHISEHFEYFDSAERRRIQYTIRAEDAAMRAVLPMAKWKLIQDALQMEFNQRLKVSGAKSSRFEKGFNVLPRLFGKELLLLVWAIEDADPGLIPTAIRNWQGLKPEERWWLFTMTNAATGQAVRGRDRGWRKALRFALTENPVE